MMGMARGIRRMRTTLRYGVLPLAACAAAVPMTAAAQDSAGPKTDIRLDLAATYEGNVARTSDALAAARGIDGADQRLTPSLVVDVGRTLGAVRIDLQGALGYDFYRRNTELNRERVALDTLISVPAGPCRTGVAAGVSRRQSDLGDITFDSILPDADPRNAETRISLGGNIACGRRYGLRPAASIDFISADNSNPLRDRAEYDTVNYRGGLQYETPALGEVFGFVGRRDITLRNQPVAAGRVDYSITDIGMRFRRNLTSRFSIDAEVAHSSLDGNGQFPDASALNWNLSLTALAGSRLQLAVATGRQFTNSLSSDAVYVRSQPNSLRATYALNDRIRLRGTISSVTNRYSYPNLPVTPVIERDTRRVISGDVIYRLTPRLGLEIGAGQERRNANGTVFDYSSGFARAAVSLTF